MNDWLRCERSLKRGLCGDIACIGPCSLRLSEEADRLEDNPIQLATGDLDREADRHFLARCNSDTIIIPCQDGTSIKQLSVRVELVLKFAIAISIAWNVERNINVT